MCLDEILTLLNNDPSWMGNIEIEVCHDGGDVLANFDEEQMKQVILNLAINACEAMQGSGKLIIRTAVEDGGFVKVVFQDEGPGIGEDEKARLFEPFFTTKEGGTGLGLAIANKIVEAHGGRIEARNRTPRGAEFSVVIPIRVVSRDTTLCLVD